VVYFLQNTLAERRISGYKEKWSLLHNAERPGVATTEPFLDRSTGQGTTNDEPFI
jgi:hypothetical protein